MLRLRLKRLICFCLTLCLLFCSNMTVFALDEIHNTNEEEPYFKYKFTYYTNGYDYGVGDDAFYSSFFHKDLTNSRIGDLNVRIKCINEDGIPKTIKISSFSNFYASNNDSLGLLLNNGNGDSKVDKSLVDDDLWVIKSLSNANILDCSVSINSENYNTYLDIVVPYNVSNNDFNLDLQSYVDTNTVDGYINGNSYNDGGSTFYGLCFNQDNSNSDNFKYFNSSSINSNKFNLKYYYSLEGGNTYYKDYCYIGFDLFYILNSKGLVDTDKVYKETSYDDPLCPIDSSSEDRYTLSNIHYSSEDDCFSFDYSSDSYYTDYTYVGDTLDVNNMPALARNLSELCLEYDFSNKKFYFTFKPHLFLAPNNRVNLTYFTQDNYLNVGDFLYKDEVYFLNSYHAEETETGKFTDFHAVGTVGDLDIRDTNSISLLQDDVGGNGGTVSGSCYIFKPERNYKVRQINLSYGNFIEVTLEKTDFDITFINHYKPDETITVSKDKASNERITDSDFPENASDIFLVNNNNSGDYKKITKDEIKNLSEDTEVHYIPKSFELLCKDGDSLNDLGYVELPLIENDVTFNDDDGSLNDDSVYFSTVDIKNKEFNGVTYDEWLIENNSYNNNNHNREYTYKKFEDIQKYKAGNLIENTVAYALLPDSLGKCVDSSTVIYKGEGLKKKMDEMDKLDNFHYTCTGAELFKGNITVNKPPIGHNFQSGTPSNITNTITTQEQLTNLINNAESVKLDNQPYTNQAIDLSKVTSIIKTECGRAPEQCTSPKAYEVEIITQASTPPTPPTPPVTPPSNPHEHTWGTPKKENEKEPTCTKEGSYDLVTRCESCGAELKREHKIIEPLGHIWEDNTWTKLEKSQVNKELFNKAENASKLDFSKLKDTDDVWKRLCSRASDAYELRVVDSDLVGTVSGVLKDKNGKPIANAKVTLHSTPRTVYTNEKGEYKFEDVESGNHTLNVYVSDDSVYQGYIFISNDSTVETVDKSKDYEAIEDAKDTNVTVDINGLDSSNPSGGGDNPSDNPDDGDDPDNPDDVDDPDNPNDFDDPDNPNDFDDPDDFPGDTPEGLPIKVPENTPTDEPDDTPDGRPHKTSDYNIWILYMMLALSIGTLITSVFRGRKKK